jgi:hypothetical protein
MKRIFTVFVVLLFGLVLVSCGPNESTAKGYGITHKIYVGEVEVTVDKEGVVTAATIEEYYLPFNVAVIESPAEGATDVVQGDSHGVKYFAKYFKVNDLLFIGEDGATDGEGNITGSPVYKLANGTNLLDWVAIEENAKAYVEGTQDGTVFIANEDGTKHSTYVTPEGDAWTKSATGYGGDIWDWSAQMQEIIDAIVGTDLTQTYELNDEDFWTTGDVVTGATLVDFQEYYAVLQRAHDNAMEVFE